MSKGTSAHILGTSANLLGFCLFVITSLHINSRAELLTINRLTSAVAVILAFSCLFSFSSLRSQIVSRVLVLEKIADYFFIIALLGIVVIILLISLNFVP